MRLQPLPLRRSRLQTGSSTWAMPASMVSWSSGFRQSLSALTTCIAFVAQGSNSPTFASGIENLAVMDLGNTAVRLGGAGTSLIGGYEVGFTNEQADVIYRYIRLFTVVAGTSPSINYNAFLAPESGM